MVSSADLSRPRASAPRRCSKLGGTLWSSSKMRAAAWWIATSPFLCYVGMGSFCCSGKSVCMDFNVNSLHGLAQVVDLDVFDSLLCSLDIRCQIPSLLDGEAFPGWRKLRMDSSQPSCSMIVSLGMSSDDSEEKLRYVEPCLLSHEGHLQAVDMEVSYMVGANFVGLLNCSSLMFNCFFLGMVNFVAMDFYAFQRDGKFKMHPSQLSCILSSVGSGFVVNLGTMCVILAPRYGSLEHPRHEIFRTCNIFVCKCNAPVRSLFPLLLGIDINSLQVQCNSEVPVASTTCHAKSSCCTLNGGTSSS